MITRITRFIFTLCLLLIVPLTSAQAGVLDIKEIKTDGGLSAWFVEDHSVPVIAIEFGFQGAGSALDPDDKQGLARMLSNTMDEGAGNLNAKKFQKELQDLVISLGFSAGRDDFSGSLKTLSKNKERAFELTKLALTKPRFDQEAIDRMRRANQSRIRSSLSDPGWMAARILNDKAFAGHPYAKNSGGSLSSLDAITAQDLKAFHKNFIGKNNLVISVTGDITEAELSDILDSIFGSLPDVELPEIEELELQNTGKIFHFEKDIPQTIVEIMQPGIGRDDPKFHMGQIMNFILGSSGFGSRLTEEIREKRGLTYGVYSYFYLLQDLKGFAVSTSTQNKNVAEMLKLIRGEFEKLANAPISKKELSDAKSYLIGSLPLSLTSTDKIAGLMQSLQMDGLPTDYLSRRETAIKAASVAEIQALAKDLLKPDAFITVLVGKPEGLKDLETVKSLPNVE